MKNKHETFYEWVTCSVFRAIVGFFILLCIPGLFAKLFGCDGEFSIKWFGWILVLWGFSFPFSKDLKTDGEILGEIRKNAPITYAMYKLFRWVIFGCVITALYYHWFDPWEEITDRIINNILCAVCFLCTSLVCALIEFTYESINNKGKD
jgi:hypothetical protein